MERRAEACDAYGWASAAAPTDARPPTHRRAVLVDLGRPAEAVHSCELAQALQPGQAEAARGRARALMHLGRRTAEARLTLDRLRADGAEGDDGAEGGGRLSYELAVASFNSGRHGEAAALLGRMLVAAPAHSAKAWATLGRSLESVMARPPHPTRHGEHSQARPPRPDCWIGSRGSGSRGSATS